jgi:hypothetical protein
MLSVEGGEIPCKLRSAQMHAHSCPTFARLLSTNAFPATLFSQARRANVSATRAIDTSILHQTCCFKVASKDSARYIILPFCLFEHRPCHRSCNRCFNRPCHRFLDSKTRNNSRRNTESQAQRRADIYPIPPVQNGAGCSPSLHADREANRNLHGSFTSADVTSACWSHERISGRRASPPNHTCASYTRPLPRTMKNLQTGGRIQSRLRSHLRSALRWINPVWTIPRSSTGRGKSGSTASGHLSTSASLYEGRCGSTCLRMEPISVSQL